MTSSIRKYKDLFKSMRLTPLYNEILSQENNIDATAMGFNQRLVEALSHWQDCRKTQALERRLAEANIRHKNATLSDIDYSVDRNINRNLIENLKTLTWIDNRQNIIITGGAGTGKTWLAGAFANAACHAGYTCRFVRLPLYIKRLTASHSIDQGFIDELQALKKVNLLVFDDWGLGEIDSTIRSDILEILDQRSDFSSTIITSLLPVNRWETYIADPTYSEAILERLTTNAHRIELTGSSMRLLPKYGAVNPLPGSRKTKGGKK